MTNNQSTREININLSQLSLKLRQVSGFLFSKKKWIVIALVLGSAIGALVSVLTPVKYVSRVTFVVEESKVSGGGLAAIAGQFGFDLAGSSGGGIFAGDNILLFLKSERLCRKTLLSPYNNSSTITLADKYAEVCKWKDKWASNEKIGDISFPQESKRPLTRIEDSLMRKILKKIIEDDLSVVKPDKKATFIEVKSVMRDERLAKQFTSKLVAIATEKYVDSKIKLKAINVNRLQRRADSLAALLNAKTYTSAQSQQVLIDVNPALRSMPIGAEISARDKTMIATIYTEVVKNLEVSKVSMSQETPTIEMVDTDSITLKEEKIKLSIGIIVGAGVFFILTIVGLILAYWWTATVSKSSPI
jgi:hypothetical protein